MIVRSFSSHRQSSRSKFVRAAIFVLIFACPVVAEAQFDFAGALTVKIRTYPIKREGGRPAPGKDGMPQPEALDKGRPANLQEFPAVPVAENFPGGSIMDALQFYQKTDAMAALAALQALLKNGYVELDIEKACHIDAVKLQYDHRPGHGFPSYEEAGLTALMQVLLDGVKAAELTRAEDRLRDRYNNGLSTNGPRDQETIAALQAMRLAIAIRYNPRINAKAAAESPSPQDAQAAQAAKDLFKAEVAKGKPLDGDLRIGPLHLVVKAKLDHHVKNPLPPSCKGTAKP
jgi:hypothetical protein